MSSLKSLKSKALANPNVKAEYDALEPEFELINTLLRMRHAADLTQNQVAQRNRQVRLFKRLETLVTYLKDVDIAQCNVDATNYNLDTPTKTARPNRAEALKRTHKAAAYDAWFRKQVQAAINDPHPNVSHGEAKAQFAAKKAALRKEI
ncbi:hypothetical protein B5C26_21805 [Photorhabdus luminescens]|uniref:antitoxin PaaA2 family protein n=1 Tax=Photorhabdus luminescens TaxID=29488 RepID=UPI000B4DE20B|nr:hypothetical protein [Photorhabdus luminescens]OWO79204.1 hypothetical protein B5C26_21805 [Photorhabdus luminescens]